MKLINFLKDLIAPKKCYSCQKEWHFLCEKCLEEIWFFEPICPVCKQSSKNFEVHFYCKNDFVYYDKVIILTHYKNKIIKHLIKDAKFYHRKDILEDLVDYLLKRFLTHTGEKIEDCIFIPTPMYFWKKLSRWYNQSEILAISLWKKFWCEYNNKIIKKIKSTKQQSHLSKIERFENLKWSFLINKKEFYKYKDKNFVIIDDVVSTGTTLNEISKILKIQWAQKIYGLCIASD